MKRLVAAAVAAISFATSANAFVVRECGPEFTPLTITEPWEEYSRTYAEGAIRIFEMFIDPNVASGAAIGILHPLPDEPGGPYRRCSAIYFSDEFRFFGQAFIAEAEARYDPALGLVISVPVQVLSETGRRIVSFAVNQATGTVTLL
ncbi:hypothetical protein HKCCE4037_13895 [Rhodobacterales bacterium HKCCE4037]|nr:hypothetical protein [Rhodobacterales bacterium HKCCE4037]